MKIIQSDRDIKVVSWGTKQIDLRGKKLIPGFCPVEFHFKDNGAKDERCVGFDSPSLCIVMRNADDIHVFGEISLDMFRSVLDYAKSMLDDLDTFRKAKSL